ncbi:TPR-like protein [Daedaleopsis nitida]|nr:TPR-like protein [Daedaleopsis nitida]
MAYAYYLYDTPGPGLTPSGLTSIPILHSPPEAGPADHVYRNRLLPLLLTLLEIHPQHLPLLLLLACTYYALGEFDTSLSISHKILAINSNYVEAMSNIGTTMKALGQVEKAYEWWWKALQLRPTYWDALDNILGMTFNLAHSTHDHRRRLAHYLQAQSVCLFVQKHVFDSDGKLSVAIQPGEISRLQRAVFTTGTIYTTLGPTNVDRAIIEHTRAVELVVRPPPPNSLPEMYTLRDLLLAACAAGHLISSGSHTSEQLDLSGVFHSDVASRLEDPTFSLLHLVHISGEQLLRALLRAGGGVLPTPLLLPDEVTRLRTLLFPQSKGTFPAICTRTTTGGLRPPSDSVCKQTNNITSTILLTLAKRFQDDAVGNTVLPGLVGNLGGTSVVVLLYYLALAWSPAASTYNNLGIVLSGITQTRRGPDGKLLDGIALARLFYTAGLDLDPKHPHLLTNLGSLLKDQGHIHQAIKLYTNAVEQKPDFDIALANLGNAIKDAGRPWDAIEYYRRATAVNPNLPEAICGLANSLCSICDWRGRGALPHEVGVDGSGHSVPMGSQSQPGWVTQMMDVTEEQISQGLLPSIDETSLAAVAEDCMRALIRARGRPLSFAELGAWHARFQRLVGLGDDQNRRPVNLAGFILRFIDWIAPQLQRRWYVESYGKILAAENTAPPPNDGLQDAFIRPLLPKTLQPPAVPSVLPFHTFTYPLTPRTTRLVPHRSALRISYTAYSQPWLPKHVYRPPRPPTHGKLNIGYISSDVNNHPLSHLMQSVFGMHDKDRFNVFIYTTSPWDGTSYRPRIASTVEHCIDVSNWSLEAIAEHIAQQDIHVLINLGGYTKGARNDIFAVRLCPIQMQLMGYAGTLGGGWCDYLVCDPISCPQELSAAERWRKIRSVGPNVATIASGTPPDVRLDLEGDIDPEEDSDEWLYTEKFIYMPHTFMVTDHKQSFRGDENLSVEERARIPSETLWLEEERRRVDARKRVFPDLPHDAIVFANFNQGIFLVWLRILRRVPRSVLWLLRFPAAGEEHLLRTAKLWAGDDVAARIRFTEVAKKDWHVFRTRVADLFLDTAECNAHTIAADVLWTGTPVLTWPKHTYKMCSRVAASMVHATGFGEQMVVHSAEEYENRAVALAQSVRYVPHHEPSGAALPRGQGELMELRRNMYLNRDNMPLFDTLRWTRNLEKAYREAWRRWVEGTQYEGSDEWETCEGEERGSSCIWVKDDDLVNVRHMD